MPAQPINLAFLNYITDDQFRHSLESDYREMRTPWNTSAGNRHRYWPEA
jgi:hypothetical protein